MLLWPLLLFVSVSSQGSLKVAPGKERSTVTIGIIGTYSPWNKTPEVFATYDPYNTPGWQFYDDLIIAQAAQMLNANNSILPNTTVKIKHFNNCDPGSTTTLSPAYAGIVALNISQNPENENIVAVIGGWRTATLRTEAEVFSSYNIPYCGVIPTNSLFDDKNNYKSFFRPKQSVADFDKHFLSFLQLHNIRRIGIATDLVNGLGRNVLNTLTGNGIDVAAVALVTYPFTLKSATNIASFLKKRDVRYIFIDSWDWTVAGLIYFTAFDQGIVGPNYKWMSPAFPNFDDQDTVFPNRSLFNETRDFIYIYGAPLINLNMTDFSPTWNALNRSMAANWPPLEEIPIANLNLAFNASLLPYWSPQAYMEAAYDCILTIASGIDLLLRENPSFTTEMLEKRQLQTALNIPLWQRSGFQGIGNMPLEYNDVGSANIAYYWISSNGFVDSQQNVMGQTYATSWPDGSISVDNNVTITWPSDGFVEWKTVTLITKSDSNGQTLFALGTIGFFAILSFSLFIIRFQSHHVIVNSGGPLNFVLLVGCALINWTVFAYVENPTSLICVARVSSSIFGFGLVASTFVSKAFVSYVNLWKEMDVSRRALISWIFITLVALAEVGLLRYWSVELGSHLSLVLLSKNTKTLVCAGPSSSFDFRATIALLALNIILMLGMMIGAFLTRRVPIETNESMILSMLSVGYIVIAGFIYTVMVDSDFSTNAAMREAVLMWFISAITVCTYFGSKVWNLWIEHKSAKQFLVRLRKTTHQVSQAVRRVSKVANDIKPTASELQIYKAPTKRVAGTIRKKKPTSKTEKKRLKVAALRISGASPYQRYDLKWSTWELATITVCSLSENQAWILFESQHSFFAIPFEEITRIKHTSVNMLCHYVTITNNESDFEMGPDGEDSFSSSLSPVRLMFDNKDSATAFTGILRELQTSTTNDSGSGIYKMLLAPNFNQTATATYHAFDNL